APTPAALPRVRLYSSRVRLNLSRGCPLAMPQAEIAHSSSRSNIGGSQYFLGIPRRGPVSCIDDCYAAAGHFSASPSHVHRTVASILVCGETRSWARRLGVGGASVDLSDSPLPSHEKTAWDRSPCASSAKPIFRSWGSSFVDQTLQISRLAMRRATAV